MTSRESHASAVIIPKKWFGQNFLVDHHIQRKILRACQLDPHETILEIGPGTGALTKNLVTQVKEVIAIEKDKNLIDHLRRTIPAGNLILIHADFLKFSFSEIPKNIKIIGNLPYNVATPIILKILENKDRFRDVYIMVQLEHANRLVAQAGSKEYGSLSCFIQYHAEVRKLFKVKNTAFRPIPKVHSCFLHLRIHKNPPYNIQDEEHLFKITRSVFQKRRKTIYNALSDLADKSTILLMLEKLSINPKIRPEDLTLEDYVKISNYLKNLG